MNECEDTAARTAHDDAFQPRHARLTEPSGQPGNDEEVILLRHAARLLVVLGDRCIFIAQIHLDDFLDVLVELGEALLDVIPLRPDAAVDERWLVIGQMHQSGKVLPQTDGIDDRQRRLPRWCQAQKAEEHAIHHLSHPFAAFVIGFDEQRTFLRKCERQRQRDLFVTGETERRFLREQLSGSV